MGVAVHRTMLTAAAVQPAIGAPLCAEQPLFLNVSGRRLAVAFPASCVIHSPQMSRPWCCRSGLVLTGRGRFEGLPITRQQRLLFGSMLSFAARQGGEHRRRRGRRQPLACGARAAFRPHVRSTCLPCSFAFAGGLLQGWKRPGKKWN